MITAILQDLRAKAAARNRSRDVERLRLNVAAGDRVSIVQPGRRIDGATVVNTRAQAYGMREVQVITDDNRAHGWFGVDMILPEVKK